ncbi:unnamed protein product [Euphydryas editha]|uniref:Uncharacterized protein n=1 Tax=Euphydryas editha TaxID=104508 RepID=A0AAU9TN75_EUPED|nr:unnamed protein product [Euphydryas editha]
MESSFALFRSNGLISLSVRNGLAKHTIRSNDSWKALNVVINFSMPFPIGSSTSNIKPLVLTFCGIESPGTEIGNGSLMAGNVNVLLAAADNLPFADGVSFRGGDSVPLDDNVPLALVDGVLSSAADSVSLLDTNKGSSAAGDDSVLFEIDGRVSLTLGDTASLSADDGLSLVDDDSCPSADGVSVSLASNDSDPLVGIDNISSAVDFVLLQPVMFQFLETMSR